jgi:hypothetical protein
MTSSPLPIPGHVALGREYWEFFISLSAALQRAQMYPSGHPILERAIDQVHRRLELVLAGHEVAHFAVGPMQLFVGSAATDPDHLLLRELAGRFFRRNIGAIRLLRGITAPELTGLLQAVAADRTDAIQFSTPHVEVEPLRFDALAIERSGETPISPAADQAARSVWRAIALAMLGDAGEAHTERFDEESAALEAGRAFDALAPDAARDGEVIGNIRLAAATARGPGARQSALLRRQITAMLRGLSPATIERLLLLAGGATNGHGFLLDLVQLSSAPVALEVLRAATRAEHRTMSPALLQLLGKIASHADHGPTVSRPLADERFHDAVRELIEGWDRPITEDEAELDYQETLDHLPAPLVPDLDPTEAYRSDPYRILTMSLDMAELGEGARRAIRILVARGRVTPLVKILGELPSADPLLPQYQPLVATPDAVAALLRVHPVDIEALERLTPEVGVMAAPFLLDALAEADDRGLRRRLLALLTRFGNAVAPLAIQRYPGAPWYVQRNLLRLLQELPDPPAESVVGGFAEHPEPRVRIEGLRLLLRHPAARARGIVQGLGDRDPTCVRVGVLAAVENCPLPALPLLLRMLLENALEEDLRPFAIRALAPLDDPRILEFLLRTAGRKIPLFGYRVAPRSREMLVSLGGLARHWRWHPQAGRLIARAERHRDVEVRRAVESPSILEQLGFESAERA